jgi:hypothetical protein
MVVRRFCLCDEAEHDGREYATKENAHFTVARKQREREVRFSMYIYRAEAQCHNFLTMGAAS